MPYPGLLHPESCPCDRPLLTRTSTEILRHCSGSVSVGWAFCALPRSEQLRRPGAWQVHCPRWAVHLNHLLGPSHLVSWMCPENTVSSVPCLLWTADLRLWPSWWMLTIQDLRKTWLAAGNLLTVWWKMLSLEPRLQQPLAFWLWLPLCLLVGRGWYTSG